MNSIARQIFRAVHEGKWLFVEYRNKTCNQISRFWIGIKDIIEYKDTQLCSLVCCGLHLHNYMLADNMRLLVKRIVSANIVEGTYMPINHTLVDDIICNPARYHSLFNTAANLKILNYLADCNKFETVPSLNTDFHLIEQLDESVIHSKKEYVLSYQQYRNLVDMFNKQLHLKQKKFQSIGQLCLNKLSLYTQRGLYLLAYREVFLDVEKRVLKLSNDISFNKEFYVTAGTKEGKIESIRRFIDPCEWYLLDDFEKNIQKIENIIQERISKEKIDDRPYFLYLQRHTNINLEKEYETILSMYENDTVSIPIRAFFGELHTAEIRIIIIPLIPYFKHYARSNTRDFQALSIPYRFQFSDSAIGKK